MKQTFKELKVNDRVKTLHSGMATVVKVYNEGTMVKLNCDVKKWNCPYFYEHELDFGDQDVDEQDVHQETIEEVAEKYIAEDNNNRYYNDFIAGAKWQQERNYSDVENMFDTLKRNSIDNVATITNVDLFISSWKQKFKNK
jgi:hypothetical protein